MTLSSAPPARSFLDTLRPEARDAPESGIVEVYNYGRGRQGLIPLWVGEGDLPTPDFIRDAGKASLDQGETFYTWQRGVPELRAAIASYMTRVYGAPFSGAGAFGPERFFVTAGGMHAIQIALRLVCGAGDEVIVPTPAWPNFLGATIAVGAAAVFAPMRRGADAAGRAGRGKWTLDLERIESLITPRTRAIVTISPNNPTGAVYDRAALEGIARVCQRHDLWLISDEVYDTQIWEGEHLSPRALPGMAERTIVLGSLSKSHAMTGSRLGWMIAPEAVIAAAVDLATNTTYGTPGFIQDAAVFALNQGPAFEEQIAAPFRRRRALIAPALAGSNRVSIVPSGGGMFVMLDIRATGLSGEAFALRLLDEEGIAVMPGESFGAAAAGHVRVAMTIPDEAFAEALARLGAFADRI